MATIQLGNTKVANKLISYCEKRAVEREGLNLPAEIAKSQFKTTRMLWGKTEGIQAHHVIQSFKPGEVTPKLANEIGQQLAQEIAKGHEVVVYTHTDKAHIHNHIVINAVSYEDGKKYQAHGKDTIDRVRDISDRLCQERGLSVVKEKTAEVRYTLAERALVEKDQYSWKDEIREKINDAKQTSRSYEDFKQNLLDKHGIEIRERGKHTTYINHENGKRVRGNKLGEAYEKETIKHEYQRAAGQERGTRNLPNESRGNDKLGFNEHVFRAIGADRREDERPGDRAIQRDQEIRTDRSSTREGIAGTEGNHREGIARTDADRPAARQHTKESSRNINETGNRSFQEPTGSDQLHKDNTPRNEQRTSRANLTNEGSSPGANRVRGELQAGTKAEHEGTLNGDRIANSGDRSADISGMGNANPTPSVSGSELLQDVLKAIEQSAKQIEAQQQAEQARQQQLRMPKRQQQKSQEQDWER